MFRNIFMYQARIQWGGGGHGSHEASQISSHFKKQCRTIFSYFSVWKKCGLALFFIMRADLEGIMTAWPPLWIRACYVSSLILIEVTWLRLSAVINSAVAIMTINQWCSQFLSFSIHCCLIHLHLKNHKLSQ